MQLFDTARHVYKAAITNLPDVILSDLYLQNVVVLSLDREILTIIIVLITMNNK